ncbi:3-keto-5-aminohexanoate cleavage enzyme [[Clostridium] ultunense Esp]|nr:3-keto-5-aminohexanoate cleavage enzyme [[Clostridium] ultunense Esp]
MKKAIITIAPTGEYVTKKEHPAIPTTPKEIAEDVYECYKAGAAIAHIHVRDDEENPTMALEKFKETVYLIREKCDIVLNLTTSGDIRAGDDERMAHIIELKPEIASFDCGTMNWMNEDIFVNHPKFLEKLGKVMLEHDIKPEVEIFDVGMVYNSLHYVKTGVLKEPVHYQFVLGVGGGMPATIENLIYLIRQIPPNSTWSALGVGKDHIPIMAASLLLGGHVRVGFEDNIYYDRGVLAESNAQLVERAARLVKEFNRELATPDDVREILGLRR